MRDKMEEIISIINSVGFPIFVAVILLFQYRESMRQLSEGLKELAESFREFKIEFIMKIQNVIREEIKKGFESENNSKS